MFYGGFFRSTLKCIDMDIQALSVDVLVDRLDGSGSLVEVQAISELRKLGSCLPALLLAKYRVSHRWQVRAACVMAATRYARDVDEAVELGVVAIFDRSKKFRY